MARAQGWSVLAKEALELMALAFAVRAMERPRPLTVPRRVAEPAPEPPASPQPVFVSAEAFIAADAGADTRFYRARDERGEVLAAFYGDGRVRLASGDVRLAGAVEHGRADLLDLANNAWCELFVRVAPDDRMQLELRGGLLDARVLLCEPFRPTVG